MRCWVISHNYSPLSHKLVPLEVPIRIAPAAFIASKSSFVLTPPLALTKQFGLKMLGGKVKTIICGGASVSPYIITEFREFGVNCCPGYGLTESANLVSGNPITLEKATSVGLIYPGQDYKVKDGELLIKGDHVMLEYLEDPCWGIEGMSRVRKDIHIPIATNMCVVNFDTLPVGIRENACDIILADTLQQCLLEIYQSNGKYHLRFIECHNLSWCRVECFGTCTLRHENIYSKITLCNLLYDIF